MRRLAISAVFWTLLGSFAIAPDSAIGQQVTYVNVGATGGNNGTSWADAYTDLLPALAATFAGDELWVTAGTYSAIQLKPGVGIYGGFIGNETSRSQRDPQLNQTVLGDGLSTVNGHIVVGSGVGSTAVLDGFIIRNGTAPDDAIGGVGGSGGGVFIDGGSPTFVGCVITSNTARIGAGVYVRDGSPVFRDCNIDSNPGARSSEGAGIYAITTGPATQLLTLIDCTVNSNFAWQGHFATGNGAGIYCGSGVDLILEGCTLNNNFGAHNGTYGNATTGGAIAFLGGTATITNSTFMQNISAFGAGIYCTGAMTCTNCVFIGNRAVGVGCGGPECNGAPDVPSGYGGGVYGGNITLIGCTVHANWAAKTGGGAVTNAPVLNSIFWGNRTPPVCCGEDPLPPPRDQIDGAASISFSCIEGLLATIPGEDPPDPANFPGSLDVSPRFVTDYVVSASFGWLTELGDIHLAAGSPCIDAGNNAAVPAGVAQDIEGKPRFADDPETPDTGNGMAPIVDIGAIEFSLVPVSGDVNCDGLLDMNDAQAMVGVLIRTDIDPCHMAGGDMNGDGVANGSDIEPLLGALLGP